MRGTDTGARGKRWGVILAGGDGTRLRTLTQLICGDDRPKQFCALLDDCTLLGHTVRRAAPSIPAAQTLFALTYAHREFYAGGSGPHRIVQPANRGTAPPILFSALSIEKMDEDALIAILPSDHHYSDEACFTAALESAFEAAAESPESVVLLGAEPSHPEVEYGWISLGAPAGGKEKELYKVREFVEKPSIEVARTLLGEHSVWNTFVMVGHVRAFLDMAVRAIPDVLEVLRRAELWSGGETYIGQSVYNELPVSDFSSRVLSPEATRLLVLRVRHLGWSDLGCPGRVLAVLEESRSKPRWWTKDLRKGMGMAVPPDARSAVA